MRKADPADFAPPLLRIQDKPPAPLAGWLLHLLIGLLGAIALWALFGRLDIVAVTDGKLVPSSYLKIVQPAEQGIVKEILVKEGEAVGAGQVLIRMDAVLAAADLKAIRAEHQQKRLALRRIDAQLAGTPLSREMGDSQVQAQYAANVRAHESALAQERALLEKARHDLAAAQITKTKLEQVLPHYVEQEKAFEKLTKDGFAGRILYTDKQRERIEKEQDLRSQDFAIAASRALIDQSERRIAQLGADYRRQLQTERVETASHLERLTQELAKLSHRQALLELRAPQAGIVKDLATHTAGTVAAPGTILMTLVPESDKLVAEVWVSNQDVGFVRPGQGAKLKLAAFQFQKYGMLDGKVVHVNADASEPRAPNRQDVGLFRALIELEHQHLVSEGRRYALQPGMQVAGEIHLGTRSVLEYLLSPVQKAFHEAARER
jgi:membrane fusion protein, hemolysin D